MHPSVIALRKFIVALKEESAVYGLPFCPPIPQTLLPASHIVLSHISAILQDLPWPCSPSASPLSLPCCPFHEHFSLGLILQRTKHLYLYVRTLQNWAFSFVLLSALHRLEHDPLQRAQPPPYFDIRTPLHPALNACLSLLFLHYLPMVINCPISTSIVFCTSKFLGQKLLFMSKPLMR